MPRALTSEERLARLWAREDELRARLHTTQVAARRLGLEVARSMGFYTPVSREVLSREMSRRK